MKGSERIINALEQQGVDTIFGYPGGAIMPIYDALYSSPLKHILCRHEQGAAFAAVGYARAGGTVGVCMATSGPGATNLITGLADAFIDSVPVVAITGQVATDAMGTDAFQEVDVLGLSLPVTKHSFLLDDPSCINQVIHEAFMIAGSGRPGPVLIDVPKDIQLAESPFVPTIVTPEPDRSPDRKEIEKARRLLREARRPVLYAGGGVGLAGAVGPLRRFLDKTQMPSVTTLKGIGAVAKDCPDFLGMLGMHGTRAANHAVQRCDLLLCVGARFDDRVTGHLERFAPDAKVIHLDIDAAEVNKRREADVGLLGDLNAMLPMLAQPLDIFPWRMHCKGLKDRQVKDAGSTGDGIDAPFLLRRLSDAAPIDTVICSDVGQHQMWVAQHMAFDRPENHLSSSGLGAMGFGLPAAVGARLARPNACVINVSGDGSFMMNVQELATVRRYRLPIKIVLLDNQRLGMVRQWQELFFQKRYSETDLSDNPDFVRLAASFDVSGRRISKREEIMPALHEMLAEKDAYLLHVDLDPMENVWPLVPPGASNDEMMEEQKA